MFAGDRNMPRASGKSVRQKVKNLIELVIKPSGSRRKNATREPPPTILLLAPLVEHVGRMRRGNLLLALLLALPYPRMMMRTRSTGVGRTRSTGLGRTRSTEVGRRTRRRTSRRMRGLGGYRLSLTQA